MFIAITSLAGLILGAVLQFIFTKYLQSKKHQRNMRATAYADYLLCVSEHANLGLQENSVDGRLLAAKTADAKCRISLYGASDVISSFAKFERLGATMKTPEQCRSFTEMVVAMRKDTLGGNEKVSAKDIETVVLGVG
ncbi:MAG: hypothetical protein IBX48_07150 [Thiomicrospira sp.]|uniref:hypothetical protein n=1 Tax=Thiomicrospira sp. TaxID=935 RepID=UPI0019E51CFD|nr:hypothetical protein [Thiomicrospira sp.]MBE0494105.1 hypothetical protein [Thiomicrospira sp.]